ncbi:MAG: PQQ-binding-like beta-propeller repeat protein, partial [Victivallales bacterium]|nr:PQQ-binding-like beta-propeller repeat protein [Victivallales bacterium]
MKAISAAMVLVMAVCTLTAAQISGHAWLDDNGNGKYDRGERLLEGLLVSDGYSFAVTDQRGAYTLLTNSAATTVYVQRDDRFTSDVAAFWHKLEAGRIRYDFAMTKARPIYGPVTILQCADVESHNLDYVEALKKYIAIHPETTMYTLTGDISAGNTKGLQAHRDNVTAAALDRFVAYTCGNHDTDFRGKWEGGMKCPYQEILGPWWYSFIHGGYLFVVGPIYDSWGTPIPYSMKHFGDWVQKLCKQYPDHKKIMLIHDLADLTGYNVPHSTGKLDLDEAGFNAVIYGHKHMNIVKKYASGRKAYSTATPNKGGQGCFGHCIRVIRMNSFGGESDIIYWNLEKHLEITSPNGGMVEIDQDGRLKISVAAYNGVDEVTAVTAKIANREIALKQDGFMGWSGSLCNDLPAGEELTIEVTAECASGEKLTADAKFTAYAGQDIIWSAQSQGDNALAEPMLVDGILYTAISDDVNGEKGGMAAYDAETGELLWKSITGYGIRNNFASDGKRIFAIDSRANIHAFDARKGTLLWKNASDPNIVSPSASGVACENGIVIGGYGRHLRGINAETGATLWKNTSWTTEERTPAEDRICLPGDGSAIIISRLNGLYKHDIKTGKILWFHKQLFLHATAAVDGKDVWTIGTGNLLLKLALANGAKTASSYKINCMNASGTPVITGNTLLVGSSIKGLAAVDKNTMAEKWRFLPGNALITTGDYAYGKPTAVTATPTVD